LAGTRRKSGGPISICSKTPRPRAVACSRRCTAEPYRPCSLSRPSSPSTVFPCGRSCEPFPWRSRRAACAILSSGARSCARRASATRGKPWGTEARPVPFEWLFVMETPDGPHRSIAEVARERGCDPVEAMIDRALETDMEVFFLHPVANENQDYALELIKHRRSVVTFSDSGAHVSQLMDASL